MSRIKLLFYSTESRHRWEPVWQRKRVTWEHEAEISKQSVGSALRIAKYNARWYRVLSPLSEMDKGFFYLVRRLHLPLSPPSGEMPKAEGEALAE